MKKQSRTLVIFFLALCFSLCIVLAESFNKYDSWELIFGSGFRFIISLIKTFIIFSITFFFLIKLYNYLNSRTFASVKICSNTKWNKKLFERHPFGFPWLVLMIFWLPNYILYFPGCLTYDVVRQYEQFFVGPLLNNNPVLTTFFMSAFLKVGRILGDQQIGIGIYTLFTFVLTSLIISLSFIWMKKRKIAFWLRWLGLAFWGLFPIWSAYARTAVKDTLYYTVYFIFTLAIFEIIIDPDDFFSHKRTVFGFFLLNILLFLVRHNGFYVVIATQIGLLIFCKGFRKKCLLILVSVLLFWGLLNNIILPAANIRPGGTQEMLSIPFQQTARYIKYHSDEITSDEKKVIQSVLDYENIGHDYNPDLSDPVKNTYKKKGEFLPEYFKVWWQQFLKHPSTYIQATLNGTYGYWGYMSDVRYPYGYYVQPDQFWLYNEKYKVSYIQGLEKFRLTYYKMLDSCFQHTPLTILTKPMLYTWTLIFAMGFFLQNRGKRKYWIVFIPAIISFLICLASPVNGDMRYILPLSSTSIIYLGFVNWAAKNYE